MLLSVSLALTALLTCLFAVLVFLERRSALERVAGQRLSDVVASAHRVELTFDHPNVIPRCARTQANFFGDAQVSVFDAQGAIVEAFAARGIRICAPVNDLPSTPVSRAHVAFHHGQPSLAQLLAA